MLRLNHLRDQASQNGREKEYPLCNLYFISVVSLLMPASSVKQCFSLFLNETSLEYILKDGV